jgi:hypothetical protein
VFRWNFGELGIVVQRHLCDALYVVGRTREAVETLLNMISAFGEAVRTSIGYSERVTGESLHYRFLLMSIRTLAIRFQHQHSVVLSLDPTGQGLFLK